MEDASAPPTSSGFTLESARASDVNYADPAMFEALVIAFLLDDHPLEDEGYRNFATQFLSFLVSGPGASSVRARFVERRGLRDRTFVRGVRALRLTRMLVARYGWRRLRRRPLVRPMLGHLRVERRQAARGELLLRLPV